MEQCRAVVAGPHELDLAGHGGCREEEVWDACERGVVPRGRPSGAGGVPWSTWPRTRRGRDPPALYGGRRAEQRNREERDGGEGVFVISENPGTSR